MNLPCSQDQGKGNRNRPARRKFKLKKFQLECQAHHLTEAGTSPPRRRRRHDTSSNAEERPPGPQTAGEEEVGGGGQQAAARPVDSHRGRQSKARGSRGARGGRGSRGSTRTDEEEFGGCIIDNELLIQMVEDRPPLWDHTDRRHADHHATQLLWIKICKVLVPNWDDLNDSQREECRTTILVRWRSMSDRNKKDYNEEVKCPSGSRASQKRPYRYGNRTRFSASNPTAMKHI
ncbi:uncharacterized protein LOC122925951 [Bufo gargarizans]|uniref:uncharacterized protein LOC122925951 n=1 Tax=Bufo gargarizans TaxID=30331 RepID=UPI001CF36DAA|nr:uncharacterized protein LOC122925951 [Bufo gargarizans]